MVKEGDWCVDIPDSDKVIDYLTNTYKYISIFSLIESLYINSFVDFYQFLIMKNTGIRFPIERKDIDDFYQDYKQSYGSTNNCISFFNNLSEERQHDLISRLEVRGEKASIENFAKYLYRLRSKFVHEAKLILDMCNLTSISRKDRKIVICKLSIIDAMKFFEEGLIEHFKKRQL